MRRLPLVWLARSVPVILVVVLVIFPVCLVLELVMGVVLRTLRFLIWDLPLLRAFVVGMLAVVVWVAVLPGLLSQLLPLLVLLVLGELLTRCLTCPQLGFDLQLLTLVSDHLLLLVEED